MKNKIIISFFLFVITGMIAQKNKGILYFKDGKTEKGLIKIIDNDILFKKTKKEKRIIYNHQKIDSVRYLDMKNISRKFEYINLKNTSEPILASLKVDGSLKLYKTVRNKSEYIEPNDKNQDNDWNDYKYALKVDRPTATFYLQRTTEQFATFFINFNGTKRKKFEKVITDYFEDCKSIIDKVKKKKFKMKHYREIVEYYNTECK